jgi:hypothetical protein
MDVLDLTVMNIALPSAQPALLTDEQNGRGGKISPNRRALCGG